MVERRRLTGLRSDADDTKSLYVVPTIKEYFQDLDEILAVISDGPAKSFAWRRLRYLESKWNLYVLLNEYRELAELKVCSRTFPRSYKALLTIGPPESIPPRLLQRSKGLHAWILSPFRDDR
jgi:hypothetical protein